MDAGALFAAAFVLIYLPVVELEEQHLRKLFPDYADYARGVPKLVSPLSRAELEPAKLSVGPLYRRNREYEALAGFLAGVAALVWKTLR